MTILTHISLSGDVHDSLDNIFHYIPYISKVDWLYTVVLYLLECTDRDFVKIEALIYWINTYVIKKSRIVDLLWGGSADKHSSGYSLFNRYVWSVILVDHMAIWNFPNSHYQFIIWYSIVSFNIRLIDDSTLDTSHVVPGTAVKEDSGQLLAMSLIKSLIACVSA